MVSNTFSAVLAGTAALSTLLLLSACGGSDSSPPVVAAPVPQSPQPQPAPEPAPQPTPQPQPQPSPEPPPSPAPQPAPDPAPDAITVAPTYTDLVVATNGQDYWTDGSGTGSPIAGVNCMSAPVSHHHSLISIYKDGVRLALPGRIGLWRCTYETHTHDRSGIVHVEPNVERALTVGQFFAVWGQPVSRTGVAGLAGPVRYYLIDDATLTRFDGNPADIVFRPHQQIVIITGTAPAVLPKYRWPGSL